MGKGKSIGDRAKEEKAVRIRVCRAMGDPGVRSRVASTAGE